MIINLSIGEYDALRMTCKDAEVWCYAAEIPYDKMEIFATQLEENAPDNDGKARPYRTLAARLRRAA